MMSLYIPTLTGLIRMPSSTWAVSALSAILWDKTSDSQRVFTKVVRPVPDAPVCLRVPVTENKEAIHEWKTRVGLTNDHHGELDTLLDLVAPASCVRHGY